MKRRSEQFLVQVEDAKRAETRRFVGGRHFRLDLQGITDFLRVPLTARIVDFLRIVATVYFADRLVRRDRRGGSDGWRRRINCSLELRELDFWNNSRFRELTEETVGFVSGDEWHFEFLPNDLGAKRLGDCLALPDIAPTVCLYSGGLDSAAGLARRLQEGLRAPILPVVVRHRTDICKTAAKQLRLLEGEYGIDLTAVRGVFSMRNPKRLWKEESSQRSRVFLFTGIGGVAAWMTGASAVEMYESGVGAVNFPLLAGMEGSQATRSCHPAFLRQMSEILSIAAGREIHFNLPFFHMTKGEIVESPSQERLCHIAASTVSCAHYPLRHRERKACGVCPACIFRRVAMHAAGIAEPDATYQVDILAQSGITNRLRAKHVKYLYAFLLQVDVLADLDRGEIPNRLRRHLLQTGVVERGESLQPYVDLYRRYRQQWLGFVARARANGCCWAKLIGLPEAAALSKETCDA